MNKQPQNPNSYSAMPSDVLLFLRFKDVSELRKSLATCLCLSMCGNFVLIGYDSGYVDKYNIQSGIHRGSLSQAEQGGPAHPGTSIRGICTDGLNQVNFRPTDLFFRCTRENSEGKGSIRLTSSLRLIAL